MGKSERKLNPTPSKGRVGEREDGGLKHDLHMLESRPSSCGLIVCSAVARPPAPPPPRTPQRAPHPHAYIKAYHADPYASTRRRMPSTQVSLLYTPGASCTLPPFPPPPYLYTSESCKAFSLSTSPPLRGKGMFSTFRLGGGRGSKADTSLFPVSADHMRGSNKLKNE